MKLYMVTFFCVLAFLGCQRGDVERLLSFQIDRDIFPTSFADVNPNSEYYDGGSEFIIDQISLPKEIVPSGITLMAGSLVVADIASSSLIMLDSFSSKIVGKWPTIGNYPTGLSFYNNRIYAVDTFQDSIMKLHPDFFEQDSPLPYYGRAAWGITVDAEGIYVADARSGKIYKVDPVDGSVVKVLEAPGSQPSAIVSDGSYLWVADIKTRMLYMVDPDSGFVVHRIPSPARFPAGLAALEDGLLVTDLQESKIYKILRFAGEPYVEDRKEHYKVIFRVDHRVKGTGAARDIKTYIALPSSRAGQKIIGDIEFDPQPSGVVDGEFGQKIAFFDIPLLKAGQQKRVSMSVDVVVSRVMFQINPELIEEPSLSKRDELAIYLADGRKYLLDDPIIEQKMVEALEGETRYYYRARRIYENLASSIVYDLSGGWGAAPIVLARGSGSCSEYTFALIALLRKAQIPARFVGAIVNRAPGGGIDYVFHRWAEVWLGESYGWVPVDANAGANKSPENRGAAFGSIPNRYLVTTISSGESPYLDWSYNHKTKYRLNGSATLEVTPLAIWRPLSSSD